MAWSLVGVGAVNEIAGTPLVLAEPAGVQQGDLLVACLAGRGYTSGASWATLPSGWTTIGRVGSANTAQTTSALANGAMFFVVRTSTAPTLSFALSGTANVVMGRIIAYRGHGVTAMDAANTPAVTAINTLNVSVTGLTTTLDNDLIVAMAAGGQEATWSAFNATSPSGASGATDTTTAPTTTWIERADTNTGTGSDTSLGIFDAIKATAGATGNLTTTASLGAGHVVIAASFKLPLEDAWSNADKSAHYTLSSSDKTATCSSATNGGIHSTRAYPNGTAGKYYAEFVMVSGIGGVGISLTTNAMTATTGRAIYVANNGNVQIDAVTQFNIGTAAANDVACVAYDAGAERIWFRKNGGIWNNSATADPATGTEGLDISAIANANVALSFQTAQASIVTTLRTELAEFTQAVPSGFSSWMGETPSTLAGMKVWSGSAWAEKPVKVWSGSAWVTKPVKSWNGSAWV